MSEKGRILIFVYPEENEIYLNNKFVGDSLVDLWVPLGTYRVRAQKEGYKTQDVSAVVTSDFPPEVEIWLLPKK